MIASTGLEPGTGRGERRPPSPRRRAVAEALGVEEGEPVSALRRVRTADGRRVVDVTDWCRVEHLAPEDLRGRSARSTPRWPSAGWRVDHGVAHLTPRNADGEVAERLGVPSGTLLLTIDQVDRTADGVAVLVSREHHLADAFTFTLLRRGPAGRGGALSAPLVVGVDVGSQGTCAQALEPDGTLVATSLRRRTRCPIRARAGPSRTRRSGRRALVATLSRGARRRPAGREIAALSFGSQLDGVVAAGADGEPLRPALIWCDRRAGAECEAVAERADPERLRELTGCNLDPGHVAPKIAWLARARAGRATAAPRCSRRPGSWVAWRVTRRAGGRPLERLLDRAARPARARVVAPRRATAFEVDPERLPPVRRADAVLGPVLPWLREATGLDAETLVVLGAGDEMAATLGAGVVEPGVVCDVMGTAEPVCAVVGEPAHDPTGLVELHPHADPDTWLLENPGWLSGGAYRWFRDELGGPGDGARRRESGADVYELLDALAESAPPGAGGVLVGAGAGGRDGAGVERQRARRLVRHDRRARPRAPRARAARGQRARAARRDRGDRRRRPRARARSCASAAARTGGCCASCARTSPGCRCAVPEDVETTARGAAMLAAAGAGLHPSRWPRRARAMACPRGEPVQPDPELRGVYDELHRRHRQLYAALRPLFNGSRGAARRRARTPARPPAGARGAGARASSTCSSSAAASPARARRSTPPRAGCASGSSRRATSRPGPRARRASSSTAGCATSRWATSGSCARRCASASCCSRGSLRTSSSRCRSCGRCAGAAGSARTSAPGSLLYDTHRRRALGAAPPPPRAAAARWRPRRRCAPDALVGAVQFHDALEDDARMVAVVARTAAAHGAHIATRVRVTGFRRPGEVEAVDEETGEPLRAARAARRGRRRARGPTGCASSPAAARRGATCTRRASTSSCRASASRWRPGVLARTEKSVLFVIPWQGGWLIGDTDTPWACGPDRPVATGADVDYLLAKTNALLAEPLRRDDVHGVTAGLRPLVAEAARSDTTRISRRHVVESPAPGLTTIAGGKYTTYRVMAADLIDAVARALGVAARVGDARRAAARRGSRDAPGGLLRRYGASPPSSSR